MINDVIQARKDFETEAARRRAASRDVPAIYLPFAQRALNPVNVTGAWGDMGQPWGTRILALYMSIYIDTTNNATNFWTMTFLDAAGATLATFATNTPAVIPTNTWTRVAITSGITQPSATNPVLTLYATKTLAPGVIYLVPVAAVIHA